MSKPKQSSPSDPYNGGSGGGFRKGNPGRPKGVADRRSAMKSGLLDWYVRGDGKRGSGEKKLPPLKDRMRDLLTDPDVQTRLSAERHFFDQAFGRPKETKAIEGRVTVGEVISGILARVNQEVDAEDTPGPTPS